jgi:ABC-type transporter Mla MlaB component
LIFRLSDNVAFPLFGKKTPSPSQSTAKAGAKHAPLDFGHTQDPSHSTAARPNIEVQETIHQIPEAIEQAAMLYSIEQPEAAASALEEAIQGANLARYAPRAWGMLFELYQVLARRADFERLAADYAARFETSPPTWDAADSKEAKPVPRAPANKTVVRLAGALNAKAQETLVQALKIAEKNPAVRVEVAKVTEVDDQGCALLNNVLGQLKRARKECVIVGADKLAVIVAKRVVAGEREHEQAWILLLDLYQQIGDQNAFEDAAVNYAVTFEVSPPSFEVAKKKPVAAAKPEPDTEGEGDDSGCALEGIITSNGDAAFAPIRVEAETSAEVVVDVSRLQRMDFVAATNLMNLVSALAVQQKQVRLVKASHLLTALWEVIGLDGVARIETRKY